MELMAFINSGSQFQFQLQFRLQKNLQLQFQFQFHLPKKNSIPIPIPELELELELEFNSNSKLELTQYLAVCVYAVQSALISGPFTLPLYLCLVLAPNLYQIMMHFTLCEWKCNKCYILG